MVWWILWGPFQCPEGCDVGVPALPHNIQRGGLCVPPSLVPCGSESGGGGKYIQRLAVYSYTNDRLIFYMLESQLQRLLNVLTDIFSRVGLRKNMGKMVSMAY